MKDLTRLDAVETSYFFRDLEHVVRTVYEKKYPELKGRRLCPIVYEGGEAATTYTYKMSDRVGVARWIASYASDLPRVDVNRTNHSTPIHAMGAGFGYDVFEIKAAAQSGVPLERDRATAARKAIEEKLDRVIQTGDSALGLVGMFNLPSAITYVIPNGTGGDTEWTIANKTPEEILADMHGIVNNMITVTKEVEKPDTMLLPLAQYQAISSRMLSADNDKTILKSFLENNPHIKTVEPWYALDTAGSGGSARMMVYNRNPEKIRCVIPLEMWMSEPERRNLEYVVAMVARTAGVVSPYPLSVSYADGI